MQRKTLFHRAYQATIAIKGLDGGIETLLGLIVAFAGSQRLYDFLFRLTAPELANHPASRTAHMVRHGAEGLMHASHTFIVVYLLIHGVLKLGIAITLLREKGSWIFPVATIVLLGFIGFMIQRLTQQWSYWLFAFALFDMVTLALVLNEWRQYRAGSFG